MATLTREFILDVPPDTVWSRISDVGAVNQLIDFIGEVTVEGDHRSCSMGDHGTLDELIVSVDADRKRLVYAITQSPFQFEHHSASMQAAADGDDRTRFLWTTDFKPDSVAPALEEAIDMAVDSIKRTLS